MLPSVRGHLRGARERLEEIKRQIEVGTLSFAQGEFGKTEQSVRDSVITMEIPIRWRTDEHSN